MTIADLIRLFPAVIAPVIVDRLRRQWSALDGILVWPVVVAVAVLLALANVAMVGPVTIAAAGQAVREGVMLGLAAVGLHYLARGKEAPPKVDVPSGPGEGSARPDVPPSEAWGPPPSKS